MSGRCPQCDKLVSIRVLRIEPSGRYTYETMSHSVGEKWCQGGVIR